MKNNSHVKRIFALLIIAVIMGLGIRQLLLPDTFGDIGYYRAESLKDVLKLKNIYQSEEACVLSFSPTFFFFKEKGYGAEVEI